MIIDVTFALIKNGKYADTSWGTLQIDGDLNLAEIKSKLSAGIIHQPGEDIDIHILVIYPIYAPSNLNA